MEDARRHSSLSVARAASATLKLPPALIAISLCVAGCSNRLEREQAERENELSAQRNADLARVVNEARPLMAGGNEARAIINRMETDRAAGQTASNKVGSK